jgi:hypothetical protein
LIFINPCKYILNLIYYFFIVDIESSFLYMGGFGSVWLGATAKFWANNYTETYCLKPISNGYKHPCLKRISNPKTAIPNGSTLPFGHRPAVYGRS